MQKLEYHLFDTAIGACGLVWGDHGLAGVQLPQASHGAAKAKLERRFPQATDAEPPPAIQGVIEDIVALLDGQPRDFSGATLDLESVPDFNQRVYAVARTIPTGSTLTYGEIAERLGDLGLARAVGRALGENPFPIVVPCHRVLGADGKVGGFSAHGGVDTKLRILTIERAKVGTAPTLFDDDASFGFSRRPPS